MGGRRAWGRGPQSFIFDGRKKIEGEGEPEGGGSPKMVGGEKSKRAWEGERGNVKKNRKTEKKCWWELVEQQGEGAGE